MESPSAVEPESVNLSIPSALALVFGGTTALAIIVLGLVQMAGGSWPYAFGLGMYGDRRYPFPFPESVIAGAIALSVGLILLVAIIVAIRGSLLAALITSVGLLVVLGLEAALAVLARETRRCAYGAYSGQHFCTSAATASVRDFLLMAVIPAVALLCLWWSRRPTH